MIKLKKVIILVLGMFLLSGCGKSYDNPIVTMEIEDYGTIKIELYPKYAPNTVANFVNLVESGFYDGNNFHRYVEDFVLQGGDPNGDGTGGAGYSIKGEFSSNGYSKNTLKHERGIISMARSSNPDSAGSQFFIVLDTSDMVSYSLDGNYAGFGKVIEGMDIIDEIGKNIEIEDETTGKLKENITIKKASVETFGATYKVVKNNS